MNIFLGKFGISLLMTLVLELPILLLFGARRKDLLLFLLVNILTNPAVVLLSVVFGNGRGVQLVLEGIVILTEGLYYRKYAEDIRRPLACSLAANGFSYGMGMICNLLVL